MPLIFRRFLLFAGFGGVIASVADPLRGIVVLLTIITVVLVIGMP